MTSISLTAVRNLLECSHVIQEIEGCFAGALVVTAEQDVDLVGTTAQRSGQFAAAEIGLCLDGELDTVVA